MKGKIIMHEILCVLLISYIGWKTTGYDFFVLSALVSYSIDVYKGLDTLRKRILKNTDDEMGNKLKP